MSSQLDLNIKKALIEDTLNLLNMSPDDRIDYQNRAAINSQIRLYGERFSEKKSFKKKRDSYVIIIIIIIIIIIFIFIIFIYYYFYLLLFF